MNWFTVLLIVINFAVFSFQEKSDIRKNMIEFKEACAKENNINVEMAKKSFNANNFPDDYNLKCFYKCFLQKLNVLTDNGDLNVNAMKSNILPNANKAKADAAIAKCGNRTAGDICEEAYDIAKCLRETYGPISVN